MDTGESITRWINEIYYDLNQLNEVMWNCAKTSIFAIVKLCVFCSPFRVPIMKSHKRIQQTIITDHCVLISIQKMINHAKLWIICCVENSLPTSVCLFLFDYSDRFNEKMLVAECERCLQKWSIISNYGSLRCGKEFFIECTFWIKVLFEFYVSIFFSFYIEMLIYFVNEKNSLWPSIIIKRCQSLQDVRC